MSSFSATSAKAFSAQGSDQRAELFGASVSDDPTVPNFQVGAVSGSTINWGATFRCAFSRLAGVVTLEMQGKTFNVTAKISIRRSLGLSYSEASIFRDLATGDIYEVVQIGIDVSTNAEVPVLLRRRED